MPLGQDPGPDGGREWDEQRGHGSGDHHLSEIWHAQVIGEDQDQRRDCHEIARACHEHPSQIATIKRVGSKNVPELGYTKRRAIGSCALATQHTPLVADPHPPVGEQRSQRAAGRNEENPAETVDIEIEGEPGAGAHEGHQDGHEHLRACRESRAGGPGVVGAPDDRADRDNSTPQDARTQKRYDEQAEP